MKILIARHAEDKGPEYEDSQRILTKKGIKQAKTLGKIIKNYNPTNIYCSTLRRAIITASIVGKICNLKVEENQIFNEQISGKLYGEHNENRGFVKGKDSFKGGETYDELDEIIYRIDYYMDLNDLDPNHTKKVIKMIKSAEHKLKMPPIYKISKKYF